MLCAAVLPRLSPPRKRGAVSYGDVTSANVVGYQMIKVPNVEFALFTPTFKAVGGDLDLTDIKIVDADGNDLETIGSVVLQVLDETTGGFTSDQYTHSYGLYEGWAKNDEPIAFGDVKIPMGKSFSVANGLGDELYFRVSGEVDLVCKNEISYNAFSLWGNSTPVAIDLTSIDVVDADGEPVETIGGLILQLLDESTGGVTADNYSHSYGLYEGWALNDEPLAPETFFVQPGQSFFVSNGYGDTLYLKLPCPVK